jgi:hypothetical protein
MNTTATQYISLCRRTKPPKLHSQAVRCESVIIAPWYKYFYFIPDCFWLQGQDHQAVEHSCPVQVYHPGL